jgi:hypothetical protein
VAGTGRCITGREFLGQDLLRHAKDGPAMRVNNFGPFTTQRARDKEPA